MSNLNTTPGADAGGPATAQTAAAKLEYQCPTLPPDESGALADLATEEEEKVADGEQAAARKKVLEELLDKVRDGLKKYEASYKNMESEWEKQREQVVGLIRDVTCKTPCWLAVLKCHVGKDLTNVADAAKRLHCPRVPTVGDPRALADERHVLVRTLAAEEADLARIRGVLAVWQTPAVGIAAVLKSNADLIKDMPNRMSAEPARAVFDLFLKVIPRHVAIAPPQSPTGVEAKHRYVFEADPVKPATERSSPADIEISTEPPTLVDRLAGAPFPFLLKPEEYFKAITAVVTDKLKPKWDEVEKVREELATADGKIAADEATIKNADKAFDDKGSVRAAMPAWVVCTAVPPAGGC